eukprot:jgi/Mesvir1/17906/Mv24102-RA.1
MAGMLELPTLRSLPFRKAARKSRNAVVWHDIVSPVLRALLANQRSERGVKVTRDAYGTAADLVELTKSLRKTFSERASGVKEHVKCLEEASDLVAAADLVSVMCAQQAMGPPPVKRTSPAALASHANAPGYPRTI